MKALVVIFLLAALVLGALSWPVGGRSFWHRASERGLPQATARLAAQGLHSAWDLLFRRPAAAQKQQKTAVRTPPARRQPPRKPELARAGPGRAALAPPPPPLAIGHDRIVAQAPKETLERDDKAHLEELLRAR